MASTVAFYSGLSGLNANARNLDVIGNNIANVNTTAFKSSKLLFSNLISLNHTLGSPPGANDGGSNPYQIGLGVGIAGTQRDTTGGSISSTGDGRDLAIEDEGYFVVQRGDSTYYTRAGSFRLNANNELTNISGDRLQGFGVDDDFNILPGELTNLTVALGSQTIAEATSEVRFKGNLNADGDLPTQGTTITLNALGLLTGPIGGPGGNLLETTSLLTDIEDPGSTGSPLFTAGQQVEISGATKGSKTIPDARFTVDAASTVADLMTFFAQALGINTSTGNNPDGSTPGVSLDPATGVLSIVGNVGSVSELEIDAADIRVLDSSGNLADLPFTPTATAEADGESSRTTFVVYDSRGTPVSVDITFVLESNSATGSTWRYFAESGDDSDTATVVGTGTLNFDVFGQPIGTTTGTISIDRDGTGAASPLAVTLDFDAGANGLTSLTDTDSNIAATFQDGSALGTLTSYGIGADGTITGTFSNGLTRTLGQVALATFNNPAGLVDAGGNLFSVGANSGEAIVAAPGELGSGRIIAGALELSNVDLSEEFINMILSSTGYSAASRVITTTDQLMQQLLVLGR